ncbi:MAG TPA: hypothetical protein VM822_24750 [Pseudolabrys sp.]|jgi:hypothetical protein|nr:hypothetical protein [Pseudolabrys sp.]
MIDDERVIQDLVVSLLANFVSIFWTHFQKIVSFLSVCQQTFQALDNRRQRDRARNGYFADAGNRQKKI